jgi:hypothetical protein
MPTGFLRGLRKKAESSSTATIQAGEKERFLFPSFADLPGYHRNQVSGYLTGSAHPIAKGSSSRQSGPFRSGRQGGRAKFFKLVWRSGLRRLSLNQLFKASAQAEEGFPVSINVYLTFSP